MSDVVFSVVFSHFSVPLRDIYCPGLNTLEVVKMILGDERGVTVLWFCVICSLRG